MVLRSGDPSPITLDQHTICLTIIVQRMIHANYVTLSNAVTAISAGWLFIAPPVYIFFAHFCNRWKWKKTPVVYDVLDEIGGAGSFCCCCMGHGSNHELI